MNFTIPDGPARLTIGDFTISVSGVRVTPEALELREAPPVLPMLPPGWLHVAADLIEAAEEQLGDRACDLLLPEWMSRADRLALDRAHHVQNEGRDPPSDRHRSPQGR